MGYTNKLQRDRVTGVPFSGMAHTDNDGERARVTDRDHRKSSEILAGTVRRESMDSYDTPYESPFYPSERVITAFNASRFGRIWTTLLGRYAGPPQ